MSGLLAMLPDQLRGGRHVRVSMGSAEESRVKGGVPSVLGLAGDGAAVAGVPPGVVRSVVVGPVDGVANYGDGRACRAVLVPVSYTHLRAHETVLDLVCRLLLEKKKH